MKRQHIFLTDKQIKNLSKEAKEKELKVSELIRRIIDKYYEEDGKENEPQKRSSLSLPLV